MFRHSACSFCGNVESNVVGNVEFWDLQTCALVSCPQCDLMQLDPKLTPEATAKGCNAYYRLQAATESVESEAKNAKREFRKGIAFAVGLALRGFRPRHCLEYGAGSGYFARGLRFIFKDCNITCVDVVPEILMSLESVHGFKGIQGEAGSLPSHLQNTFDLVVARDVLEHVSAPQTMVAEVMNVLRPGGLFHFLTPNGFEDSWGIRLAHNASKQPCEILLNHVNYFSASGLEQFLLRSGFKKLNMYIYGLKWFFRGRGWRRSIKLQNRITTHRTSKLSAPLASKPDFTHMVHLPTEKGLLRFPYALWCYIKSFRALRLWPSSRVGHEIFGLFAKPKTFT